MTNGIGKTVGGQEWRQAVQGGSARLLALLWLLVAVLAMPLVASAQIVASGAGAFGRAGDIAGRDGRAAEAALSRQALRAAQPADLRFTAERVDAKPVPGGPNPFLLAVFTAPRFLPHAVKTAGFDLKKRLYAGVSEAAQARAPPAGMLVGR